MGWKKREIGEKQPGRKRPSLVLAKRMLVLKLTNGDCQRFVCCVAKQIRVEAVYEAFS
jgi:hypothetical protein